MTLHPVVPKNQDFDLADDWLQSKQDIYKFELKQIHVVVKNRAKFFKIAMT